MVIKLNYAIISDMERYYIIDTKELATFSVNDIEFTDPTEGGSAQYDEKEDFIEGIKEETKELNEMLEKRL